MKTHHHKSTVDAATHFIRVPFQRRHTLARRHVPHLERPVVRPRNNAPPVRRYGNALDLLRSQIITKAQRTPQRTSSECPSSVATHSPVTTSHTLITPGFRKAPSQETTRRPSGDMATQLTYNEETSSRKCSGRRNARCSSALAASPHTCPSPRPTP